MRTTLGFSGVVCSIAAVGCVVLSLLGEPGLLLPALVLFVVGIVLLSLAAILDRLTHIEFLLRSSRAGGTDQVRTKLGDFEMLADVEGQATCIGCRKTVPKAGMYYSRSLDVYYHPQCLARDSRK